MPRSPTLNAARHWCFTLNNPSVAGELLLDGLFATKRFDYIICQLETGKEGTPHLQGYFCLTQKHRLTKIKKLFGAVSPHFENMDGTVAQNIHYCSKPVHSCECEHCTDCPPRLDGPWTVGTAPVSSQGNRSDLKQFAANIVSGMDDYDLAMQSASAYMRFARYRTALRNALMSRMTRVGPPTVVILYGPTGAGKSRFVYDSHPAKDIFKPPIQSGKSFWFDGYYKQPNVLFEEFSGNMKLTDLLRLTDRYPELVPIKCDHVCWQPTNIYFCTNEHPSQWYKYSTPGRVLQYSALKRRVTSLVLWDSAHRRLELRASDPAFDEWFAQPLRTGLPEYMVDV